MIVTCLFEAFASATRLGGPLFDMINSMSRILLLAILVSLSSEPREQKHRRSGHPFFMSLHVAWFISLLIAGYSESAYQIINLFRRDRKRQHTTKIYKCYNNYEILIFLFCTLFLLLPLGINLARMLKLMLACVDTTR